MIVDKRCPDCNRVVDDGSEEVVVCTEKAVKAYRECVGVCTHCGLVIELVKTEGVIPNSYHFTSDLS